MTWLVCIYLHVLATHWRLYDMVGVHLFTCASSGEPSLSCIVRYHVRSSPQPLRPFAPSPLRALAPSHHRDSVTSQGSLTTTFQMTAVPPAQPLTRNDSSAPHATDHTLPPTTPAPPSTLPDPPCPSPLALAPSQPPVPPMPSPMPSPLLPLLPPPPTDPLNATSSVPSSVAHTFTTPSSPVV